MESVAAQFVPASSDLTPDRHVHCVLGQSNKTWCPYAESYEGKDVGSLAQGKRREVLKGATFLTCSLLYLLLRKWHKWGRPSLNGNH